MSGNNEQRPVVSLWREIRVYLELPDKTGIPAPIANCPICQVSELSIQGILPSSKDADLQKGVVTVCGHMACEECLNSWLDNLENQEKKEKCPVCRHEFHYSDCGCNVPSFTLPGYNEEISENEDDYFLNHLPLTLPEGGTQHEQCNQCRYRCAAELAKQFEEKVESVRQNYLARAGNVTAEELELIKDMQEACSKDQALWKLRMVMETEYPSWGGDTLYRP